MLFIDIGSMDGQEIKWALERGYEVHAFEPNPHLKESLIEQFGNDPRVKINFAAAWNQDGIANLYKMRNQEPGEDGISLLKEKINVGEDFIQVPTINIGQYLAKLDEDVDVLKINAEGAEYIILESILDHFDYNRIKNWWVEDHEKYIFNWRDHKKQVLDRIESLGIIINEWKNIHANAELLG